MVTPTVSSELRSVHVHVTVSRFHLQTLTQYYLASLRATRSPHSTHSGIHWAGDSLRRKRAIWSISASLYQAHVLRLYQRPPFRIALLQELLRQVRTSSIPNDLLVTGSTFARPYRQQLMMSRAYRTSLFYQTIVLLLLSSLCFGLLVQFWIAYKAYLH